MGVIAIALALGTGTSATVELASVLTFNRRFLAGGAAPGFCSAAASRPVGAEQNT